MKNYTQLQELVAAMAEDANKFHTDGVAKAGGRLRKGLMDIKKLCGTYRKEIQSTKKASKKPAKAAKA